MRYRRNDFALFGAHRIGENHEWRIARMFEIFSRYFPQHRRRKWTPPFAEFDCIVNFSIHFRIARICQNRAVSESAWTKFHSSLEPTNDPSASKKIGGCSADIIQLSSAELVCLKGFCDFGIG